MTTFNSAHSFELGPVEFNKSLWEYYYFLWTDRRWIHRRVDTIGSTDSSHWTNVDISFDINGAVLEATTKAYRLSDNERRPVPLMLHPKTHLLSFHSELNGAEQSLAGADDATRITQAISFYSFLREHPELTNQFERHFQQLANDTYQSIKSASVKELSEKIEIYIAETDNYLDQLARSSAAEEKITPNQSQTLSWETAVELAEYAVLLSIFISHMNSFWGKSANPLQGHSLIIVKVDRLSPAKNATLKLRFVKPHGEKLGTKVLGHQHKTIQYRESMLGSHFENRYHIRIDVPSSLKIVSVTTVEESTEKSTDQHAKKKLSPGQNGWIIGGQGNHIEIHDRKISNHPSNRSDATSRLIAQFEVEPKPQAFYTRASFAVFALILFLLFTDLYHSSSAEILTASIAIAALFVAVPKLLGRDTEDSLTANILSRMRLGLSVLTGICFTAGLYKQLLLPPILHQLCEGETHSDSCAPSAPAENSLVTFLISKDKVSEFVAHIPWIPIGNILWATSLLLCIAYFLWIIIALCVYYSRSRKSAKNLYKQSGQISKLRKLLNTIPEWVQISTEDEEFIGQYTVSISIK